MSSTPYTLQEHRSVKLATSAAALSVRAFGSRSIELRSRYASGMLQAAVGFSTKARLQCTF